MNKKLFWLVLIVVVVTLPGCGLNFHTYEDGQAIVITDGAACWQYPGGWDASNVEAPLGQSNNGYIEAGTAAVIRLDYDGVFGPSINDSVRAEVERVYVFVPGSDLVPVTDPHHFGQTETRLNVICWVEKAFIKEAGE